MTTLRNLFYLLVGAALAIFIYFNFDQAVIIYLTPSWHTEPIPLALALFGSLLVGFVVAALLAVSDQMRLRSRLRHLRRTVERLEAELGELRKLPLGETLPARPATETRKTDSASGEP